MPNQQEWELLKNSSIKACLGLTFRHGFIALLSFAGNLCLVRILSPTDFGVFAIGSIIVKFANFLEDMGLGASVIQQKDEPKAAELLGIFLAQLWLVLMPFCIVVLLTPILAPRFHLEAASFPVIYWLAGSKIIIMLRSLPTAVMQRNMEFISLSKYDILQVTLHYLTAIILGCLKMGALSLALGTMISQAVTTGALLVFSGPAFARGNLFEGLVKRLKFGVPYQLSMFLGSFRDSVVPLYGGIVLGPAAIGQANFALTAGNLPRIFSSVVQKSYFPLFAQCQTNEPMLIRLVESVLFWSNLIVIGINAIFLPLAPAAVGLIFGEKWLPSLPLLYAYLIGNIVVATTGPLQGLIYAIGKVRINMSFQLIFVVLTWGVTIPLISTMGLLGIAVAQLILLASQYFYFLVVRRQIKFSLSFAYFQPFLIGGIVLVCVHALTALIPPHNLERLFLLILCGLLIWLLLVFVFLGSRFKRLCSSVLSVIRQKSRTSLE